jgi:uncharacterized protein YjdB
MNFVTANNERVPADPGQVSWVSTNPAVATVTAVDPFSGAATVTGLGLGTAMIQGTYRGFTLSATITVFSTVDAIDVNLTSTTLTVGRTTQATAVLYNDRRAILTGPVVTWQSSPAGVVSVSSSGLVTALAPGIAQIDAIAEGKTGTIYITVVPP